MSDLASSFPGLGPPLLLFVVEGGHDIHFLRRISRMLHAADSHLPDLAALEAAGRLVFIPAGGDSLEGWAERLAPLRWPQFHLFDRELPPYTGERQRLVEAVNQYPGCVARLTGLRSAENYLHAAAIQEVCGIRIEVGDDMDVPAAVARQLLARNWGVRWKELSPRAQRRLRNRRKTLLNTAAVERMTPERLQARDPAGDVRGWMDTSVRPAGRLTLARRLTDQVLTLST